MPDFTHTCNAGGSPLEFRFTRIEAAEGIMYFIGVMGRNHRSYSFWMKRLDDGWKIITDPELPSWLVEMESQLCSIIREMSKTR